MEELPSQDKAKNLASGNIVKDLLFLDTMLTPKIITFVYWILLVGLVIVGIVSVVQGGILRGVFLVLFGAIFIRIWCEISIVFFRMNEALQEMRNK